MGSRTIEKAQAFIKDVGAGAATAYGSYEEVLDDPAVHGVYIPLPSSLHLEWVKKAAAKGKHILLEKPIATVSRTKCANLHLKAQLGLAACRPML